MSDQPKPRKVQEWLDLIKEGKVAIPEFQRGIVWKDSTVADFLLALLKERPVGVFLLLDLDPADSTKTPFKPRPLRGAPEVNITTCGELILDGQQRLTALWRALNDKFYSPESNKRSYRFYIEIENLGDENPKVNVKDVVKNECRGKDNPIRDFERNLVPVHLLIDDCTEWCDTVFPNDSSKSRELEKNITTLSEKLRYRDISYYELPKNISRQDAIEAYIKTNESSVKVSRFDIAVAEIESKKEQHLRDFIKDIEIELTRRSRFFGDDEDKFISDVGELVLKIACLLPEPSLLPTDKNYVRSEVIDVIIKRWNDIVKSIDWTLDFLEKERIWDKKRLPSVVPLRVIPALHANHFPKDKEPDKQAKFRKVVRQYLWRCFVTKRYERNVNARLWEDYKEISASMFDQSKAPILDNNQYPIPSIDQLSDLEYPLPAPTGTQGLSRALLVVSLRPNAVDLASNEQINKDNIRDMQYHHLFPKALLEKEKRPPGQINHALNFALISKETNRKLAARPPVEYLKNRLQLEFTVDDIKRRVKSHLIPFNELNVDSGKNRNYEKFIKVRADYFVKALQSLCEGKDYPPTLDT